MNDRQMLVVGAIISGCGAVSSALEEWWMMTAFFGLLFTFSNLLHLGLFMQERHYKALTKDSKPCDKGEK